jgi:hypothetical protein
MSNQWIFPCILLYLIGLSAVAFGFVFEGKQTNPIRDAIHWMSPWLSGLLWPLLLPAWIISGLLSSTLWPDYISHREHMETIVDDIIAEIDRDMPNAGTFEYGIPSPRKFRKYGRSAIDILVEVD